MKQTDCGGVKISYHDLGQGSPALLLMPAWCMSHAGFARVPWKLAESGRVLALDWPGHGQSEVPPADFGWRALVDSALAVIEASGERQVVPVAMSHAGWANVELRRRLGDRIPQLVHLDWIVLPPPDVYLDIVHALADPGRWEATRDQLFAMWLEGTDNPELTRFVRGEMGGYGEEMWLRSGREIGECYALGGYPLKALAGLHPPVETLHIYAQPADPEYLQAQQAFAAENPWFHVHRLDARSHFPTYEVPDDIAAAIRGFVSS